MSDPLTASAKRDLRKQLVRLRMEMNRQQLIYNARPLTHPMSLVTDMIKPRANKRLAKAKTPMALGASVLLTLFGKRLGMVGKLAKVGLALYPLISRARDAVGQHDPAPPPVAKPGKAPRTPSPVIRK